MGRINPRGPWRRWTWKACAITLMQISDSGQILWSTARVSRRTSKKLTTSYWYSIVQSMLRRYLPNGKGEESCLKAAKGPKRRMFMPSVLPTNRHAYFLEPSLSITTLTFRSFSPRGEMLQRRKSRLSKWNMKSSSWRRILKWRTGRKTTCWSRSRSLWASYAYIWGSSPFRPPPKDRSSYAASRTKTTRNCLLSSSIVKT